MRIFSLTKKFESIALWAFMVALLVFVFPPSVSGALVNGNFSVNDPVDSGFGWTFQGPVTFSGDRAILAESDDYMARLEQTFTLAAE
ncbi:hypothetical protein ACFL9U_14595, partial [Thermodesulfobacteriota bacterium]